MVRKAKLKDFIIIIAFRIYNAKNYEIYNDKYALPAVAKEKNAPPKKKNINKSCFYCLDII